MIVCDFHIKLAFTYLCEHRKLVCEKCTLKAVRSSEWMVVLVPQNRKAYGENGCANVAKVEVINVIWKKAGHITLYYYVLLITLSSAMISRAYGLPNSLK